IVFLHKIAPGSADKSYGIHVARLAGVPEEVLNRARQVLADLEAHHLNGTEAAQTGKGRRRGRSAQPGLFAHLDPVLLALRDFDLARASPEDVAAQVRRWQDELGPRR